MSDTIKDVELAMDEGVFEMNQRTSVSFSSLLDVDNILRRRRTWQTFPSPACRPSRCFSGWMPFLATRAGPCDRHDVQSGA
jgi:hypothetical protein